MKIKLPRKHILVKITNWDKKDKFNFEGTLIQKGDGCNDSACYAVGPLYSTVLWELSGEYSGNHLKINDEMYCLLDITQDNIYAYLLSEKENS